MDKRKGEKKKDRKHKLVFNLPRTAIIGRISPIWHGLLIKSSFLHLPACKTLRLLCVVWSRHSCIGISGSAVGKGSTLGGLSNTPNCSDNRQRLGCLTTLIPRWPCRTWITRKKKEKKIKI